MMKAHSSFQDIVQVFFKVKVKEPILSLTLGCYFYVDDEN